MKLCVIPARGGSKRIPRKNIKEFRGKPIITYSIEAAIESGCFDKVIVSTDDDEVAAVARESGAEIPFIRPHNLADDHAGTLPVIKHAIEWFESNGFTPEEVCCLYATAPFVKADFLVKAYEQLLSTDSDYCFTVTNYSFPIQRAIKITREQRVKMFYPQFSATRSQDLEHAYHDAGQFYWGKSNAFKELKPFFSEYSSPFLLPQYYVQDIDSIEDWLQAEVLFESLRTLRLL